MPTANQRAAAAESARRADAAARADLPIIDSADLNLQFAYEVLHQMETTAAEFRRDLEAASRAETWGDARPVLLIDAGRDAIARLLRALELGPVSLERDAAADAIKAGAEALGFEAAS